MSTRLWAPLLTLALSLSLTGCGDSNSGHTVTGQVTYQDQAVTQGTINFRATDGKLYGGGLGDNGSFSYQLPKGDYQVRIDAPAPVPSDWKEGDPVPTGGERLAPMQYSRFASSGLKASITDDPSSHQLNFQLK